jgi:dUTP pyrophosphatase
MKILFKKLQPNALIPQYAHPGDAGMDLVAIESYTLAPHAHYAFSTGLAMELPEGLVALVWDKSGRAVKEGLKTMAGVIDSGYRGEIKIALLNTTEQPVTINSGEKIAQLLIQRVERPEIEEVNELSNTQRGAGGFGSTGK